MQTLAMDLDAPISTIMTAGPESVTPQTPLVRVQDILFRSHVHHVPVTRDRTLVGIVSSNDLLIAVGGDRFAAASSVGAMLERLTVAEAMTTELVTLGPQEPIRRAVELLRVGSFHALPIVQDDELVGIVTTADLLGLMLAG